MTNEENTPPKKQHGGPLFWLDSQLKKVIPNFNARAVIYLSLIFATAIYIQIWRISSRPVPNEVKPGETVIADDTYWAGKEYEDRINNQTAESFASELSNWLNGKDKELVKRKFEDLIFINPALTLDTGGDLETVVPEGFNYLENIGKARYGYAKDKGFLADTPTLVKLGTVVCDISEKTEQLTGIELYDWRYASMPKLASFMSTKPDCKVQIGDKILNVSDPRIEDKDVLKYKNTQTQPAGLFSFLIFHNKKNNRITLADTSILEMNGVDAKLTLARITSKWDKQPKLYFEFGFEGCKSINSSTIEIDYGYVD